MKTVTKVKFKECFLPLGALADAAKAVSRRGIKCRMAWSANTAKGWNVTRWLGWDSELLAKRAAQAR